MPNSGWLVKATHDDGPLFVTGLRARKNEKNEDCGPGYQELVVDLAETFDLIPSSVMVFSLHQGTKLNVHLGSQGDLDVVLAEAMEWGSHVISVSVNGVPARRSLDALGALADAAATLSQLVYLFWIITYSNTSFYNELVIWSVMIVTLLSNLGGYAYLLDDESDKNHPFRLWIRPFSRRAGMLVLAPFTGDVLPLVGCKACGLDAPIRPDTRDGVVKWGILMMAFQHGILLWLLYQLHVVEGQLLSTIPLACLALTAAAVTLNLPRRLSHFILGSCEHSFRAKEELADDARISMYAAQKMAHVKATGAPPESPPPESPVSSGTGKPKKPAGAAKPAAKAMSFREQMKAGPKGAQKSMY